MSQVPSQFHKLFAIMLNNCDLSNPMTLWQNHRESLAEDILQGRRLQNPDLTCDFDDDIFNEALILLEDATLSLGGKVLTEYELHAPDRRRQQTIPQEVLRETSYNIAELAQFVAENEPKLVDDQRRAYTMILNSARKNTGGIFFIDAPGGTGKTFVINLLLASSGSRSVSLLLLPLQA